MSTEDMKLALNAQITSAATSQALMPTPAKSTTKRSVANTQVTEWSTGGSGGGGDGGGGGGYREHWPEHLPKPPSLKNLVDTPDTLANAKQIPQVIVFNANMKEGSSMARVLSEKGLRVVAVVRVFTNRNTKMLLKLKNVTVKVADLNDKEAVLAAAEDCQSAFFVTKYWERFESPIEETMTQVVVDACADSGIKKLVLATFEDIQDLKLRGRKSQLTPTPDGRIFPSFDGMDAIDAMGKKRGVSITHMMTSYYDEADSKKSLILVRAENGRIVCQNHIQDAGGKKN